MSLLSAALPHERMPGSGSTVSKAKQDEEELEHSNTMDVDARLSEAGGTRWRTTSEFQELKVLKQESAPGSSCCSQIRGCLIQSPTSDPASEPVKMWAGITTFSKAFDHDRIEATHRLRALALKEGGGNDIAQQTAERIQTRICETSGPAKKANQAYFMDLDQRNCAPNLAKNAAMQDFWTYSRPTTPTVRAITIDCSSSATHNAAIPAINLGKTL